ncbi:hypothetical protein AB0D04_37065 [Streptomyces sp. NPDC048483]|uniref:hypothetical protein n=1 Tax=Streptomyces sp. NPDC048483 TaxID=3154927 RepID=UPI0034436D40
MITGSAAPLPCADGSVGRVVTWPDPDAYVLVDGVLVRALPLVADALLPGSEVTVRWDAGRGRPVAGAVRG